MRIEALEPRLLLDGDGFLNGTDVHLTLSFASDGTDVAGQPSALAATFDSIAPSADWQDAILRAFQTWAIETNADVGVVSENGDPFGAPGLTQRDDRFGDIRIGAIAMSPEVGAVSVPVDGVVAGTWFADVVFNTEFAYQSLDDIFAVALHEAGNVFGLEDNTDPNSPLFIGGAPTGLPPTTADLAALQSLHGSRVPDQNELPDDDGGGGPFDNDSFANATQLKLLEATENDEGSAPSFTYGDITTHTDLDIYKVKTSGDYTGSVTFQIRSVGISLLRPEVTIYNAAEQVVDQLDSTSSVGDFLTYQLPGVAADSTYYVEVSSDEAGLNGIGGYSLVVIFDGINQIDQQSIDEVVGGQFRFLESDDFEHFFDANGDDHFAVDLNSNDLLASATGLKTAPGFIEATRYQFVGSINNTIDADFYTIKSPVFDPLPADVMTVSVKSLDAGGLIPTVTVYGSNELPISARILANGGGDYIVQVDGVSADDEYSIEVAASDPAGPFSTGNYDLVVTFGDVATQLTSMSSGSVGNGTTQNTHTLHIGQPQLFHFALQVDSATVPVPTVVVATILNAANEPVYQIASRPGDTRSKDAVLLQAGSYTVEVVPWTLDGSTPPELSYALLGASISDPFVGDPDDPNAHPFACEEPGMEGLFCYPGGFISPDPFLWDTFIDSLTTPVDGIDLGTLVSNMIGDWWSWVWNSMGVNGPPLALSDTTQVPVSSAFAALSTFIRPTDSLLDNDLDPEGGAVVAIKKSDPQHGTVVLNPNGTFVYTPDPGFVGRDTFTYAAFDFTQESEVATVAVVVGESGDFDADGDVDGGDFLAWQRGHGQQGGALLPNGDSNFDGNVNVADLGVWEQQFATTTTPVPSGGDADADGDFDGADFLAWQRGYGIPSGASAADGDADANGAVDENDLAQWETNFGTGGALVSQLLAASVADTAGPVELQAQAELPHHAFVSLSLFTSDGNSTRLPFYQQAHLTNFSVENPPVEDPFSAPLENLLAESSNQNVKGLRRIELASRDRAFEEFGEHVKWESFHRLEIREVIGGQNR
ncbi:hypothetical protein HG15A2_09340 [Adhaeretor mobilis]|uniref:Peptidase M10 metallopeptidase domain-containing protein n=1 Tax=Adhaeretor mobilis TaxID=1930276 RepID=A0A517MS09_9BACT|nr:hypothetical protein HG15A2_09340 [Adhaeretor mobilis]